MKRIPDDHVSVSRIRGPSGGKCWGVRCLVCGLSILSFRDPETDGYLVWFRGRHFECLPDRDALSVADELWLRHATSRIRAPRKK